MLANTGPGDIQIRRFWDPDVAGDICRSKSGCIAGVEIVRQLSEPEIWQGFANARDIF